MPEARGYAIRPSTGSPIIKRTRGPLWDGRLPKAKVSHGRTLGNERLRSNDTTQRRFVGFYRPFTTTESLERIAP